MLTEMSAHFYKHLKMVSRRPGEMAFLLLHPIITLLSLGIMIWFAVMQGAPASTMLFVFAGIVMWTFFDLVESAVTYGLTLDIWNSCMKHTFSTKALPKHFILGNSIFGLFSGVIAFSVVGVSGLLAFGFNIFSSGAYLINLISIFFFATAIGLIINSLMVSKGEKWMALIWMITGIVMVFSGVYYPVDVLPSPIKEFSQFLPSTHAINSFRAGLGYLPETGASEFLIGFASSLVSLVIGVVIFWAGLKKGHRNGVITRY